ncbi:Protein of unknown function [Propionibacterium freudenreichii subsp. freudenreichii]|uniref:Uncharacterized protein n=1 Tax=Propionibacterium freudenreichii subsp. freudenreichii TaxID=66712 RepID=A0A068VTL8_PROFF|nr:Protein of unknown function [Propionibacterium freudenreichii subsp. freudenreichii]CEG93522.1 Protein of unknown function [Propionibacterium freudenreichii]CEG97562.1 Protein of unknown function [Propionibacterium freudenreichii]CEH05538.1 Protein of unknown function [Propionibacterium freudenreichii]CEI22130.1 Protein of unknown function [Propionibacterium freudenreichii]
MTPAPAVIG